MRDRVSYTPKHFPRKSGLSMDDSSAPKPYRPKHFARKVAVGITAASLSIGLAACAGEGAAPDVSQPSGQDSPAQLVSKVSVSYGSPDGETSGPVYDFARDEMGNITKVTISGWAGGPASSYACSYADGVLSGYDLVVEGGDSDSVTFERDADGRVVLERHSSYEVEYSYDGEGRLVSKISDSRYVPYSKSYEYDGEGRLTSSSVSSGMLSTSLMSYSYDASGRLASMQDVSTDASGNTALGVNTLLGYDESGNLTSRSYEGAGSEGMIPVTYEYDADGRVVSVRAQAREGDSYEAVYEYDKNGRLARVTVDFRRSGESDPSGKTTYDIEYVDGGVGFSDSISIGPNYGPLRSTDTVRLLEIRPIVPGITDPLPLQSDLSLLI